MSGHVERIEKALNGGNRFRRSDVSDLLAENERLRIAMAKLATHRTYPVATASFGLGVSVDTIPKYTACAGYPGCHHCWARKQLAYITSPGEGK